MAMVRVRVRLGVLSISVGIWNESGLGIGPMRQDTISDYGQ